MGRSENNENEYHIGEGVIEEEDGRGDSVETKDGRWSVEI